MGRGIGTAAAVAAVALGAGAAVSQAQERPDSEASTAKIRDIRPKVLDIERKVTSQGGAVSRRDDDRRVNVGLAADVLFRFGSAKLTSKSKKALREAASAVDEGATGTVAVQGFTDSKGSPSSNRTLSTRRAGAVRRALAPLVKGKVRFKVSGRGESAPVAPNTGKDGKDNPAGRRLNRRVEIRFRRSG